MEHTAEALTLIVIPDTNHEAEPDGEFTSSAIVNQLIQRLAEDELFSVASLTDSVAAATNHFESPAEAAAELGYDLAMMIKVIAVGPDIELNFQVAAASGREIVREGYLFNPDGYNADMGALTQLIAEDIGRMARRRLPRQTERKPTNIEKGSFDVRESR